MAPRTGTTSDDDTSSSTSSATAEAAFVARLCARDESAFEELVRVHGHRMLAVARRFFSDEADAQDALQDAFLNVHRSIAAFSGGCRIGTWLHRIVVNTSLMKLRTRRRRPECGLDDSIADTWAASAGGPATEASMTSVQAMGRAETRARVRRCIARIPEDNRTVLLLRDIEGMKILEISSLLEVSPGTVKMRLYRARHMLRELLEPYMKEDAS